MEHNNLEDLCLWHEIAKEEKELNDMQETIKSYKNMGCYDCKGYNNKCPFYQRSEHEEDD